MALLYILDNDGNPKEATMMEWLNWFTTADRHIKSTMVSNVDIKTYFIGINANLWETTVCGNPPNLDGLRVAYQSKEEAIEGHERMVTLVQQQLNKPTPTNTTNQQWG